jgi:hypothetical protein
MTADRSLIARLAAHESWANTADPSARTAPARRALLDRFERQIDPDGVLSPTERARRAGHARKAYFARLALRSAQARRKTPAVENENGRPSRPDEDQAQLTGSRSSTSTSGPVRTHRLSSDAACTTSPEAGAPVVPSPACTEEGSVERRATASTATVNSGRAGTGSGFLRYSGAGTRPTTHPLTLMRDLRFCRPEQRLRVPLPEDAG